MKIHAKIEKKFYFPLSVPNSWIRLVQNKVPELFLSRLHYGVKLSSLLFFKRIFFVS